MTMDDWNDRENEAARLLGGYDPSGGDGGGDTGTAIAIMAGAVSVLPSSAIPAGARVAAAPARGAPAVARTAGGAVAGPTGAVLTDAAVRFGRPRPGDVRFADPAAFADAMRARRARATEAIADLRSLRVTLDGDDLAIVGRSGVPARATHYALGQLCARVKAPADFIRGRLDAGRAADVLSYCLETAEEDGATKLLFARHADGLVLRAATGEGYGRVWDADVAAEAADAADRAGFQAPIAFRSAGRMAGGSGPTPQGAERSLPCAVASDRDAFLFMVDYDAQIRVPGYDHPLFRGFFLSNSEVGAGSLAITTFLLDGVCCNANVWGAEQVAEVRLRHTSGIHARTGDLYGRVRALSAQSAREDEDRIARCQRTLVADTMKGASDVLFRRGLPGVTRTVLDAAADVAASTPRYGDPRSVWAWGNALTEVSQRSAHAAERATIDRSAGKVFRIAF